MDEIMTPKYETDIIEDYFYDLDCVRVADNALTFKDEDMYRNVKTFRVTIEEVG